MARLGTAILWAIGAGAPDTPPVPATALEVQQARQQQQQPADADHDADNIDAEKQAGGAPKAVAVDAGVSAIEAAQTVWGRRGFWLIVAGLCLVMIVYELDNTTVYIYRNYAASSFSALSKLATLGTASSVIFAITKPPLAKLSNVMGRGETYLLTISFYVLSYVLQAASTSFPMYAAGQVFYSVGQSGTNLMNDVVIADITTARWRAFAIGLSFWPFLIMPWVAAFIIEDVTDPVNGMGWRWGIGMLALLMPFCSSFIIATLLYYQRKAKKQGLLAPPSLSGSSPDGTVATTTAAAKPPRMTFREFSSQTDLPGLFLLMAGLSLLLIPLTLASSAPSSWSTPWIIVLIIIGFLLLFPTLPLYTRYLAVHPILPNSYLSFRREPTPGSGGGGALVLLSFILIALDSLGFGVTHTYLYAWATVSRNLAARDATFFTYTNGCTQCLFAILAGLVMAKTRRYKPILVTGSVIRLVGYGVMARLRGSQNSVAEIFAVQLVQGVGSGLVGSVLLVPAQIAVSHAEMPQVTALVICFAAVGGSVGACVAGGIYTGCMEGRIWSRLLALGVEGVDAGMVNALANSITGDVVPAWGTLERLAFNLAFSDVMRYMTYAAIGSSSLAMLGSFFFPNYMLPDRNNLIEE